MSRFAIVRLFVCAVPLFLLGCAQQSQVAATGGDPIRISYSVGPCYGTCPVYQVAIEANGATFFNGERHTSVEVLEHDTGCHSEAGRQLTETLRSLDSLVGVAPWVRSPAQ